MTETFQKPLGSQVFTENTYQFPTRSPVKEILKKQGASFNAGHGSSSTPAFNLASTEDKDFHYSEGLVTFDRSGDGHDTGLGSHSADDDCLTDEYGNFLPSLLYLDDLDSSSQDKLENFRIFSSKIEEQIQAKYREIMTDLTVLGSKNAESNDEESVVTEELEKEFMNKMRRTGVSNRVSKTNTQHPNTESISDLESIKTEEYENRFQAAGTDQVAARVVTEKDKLYPVDSDGDTIGSLGNTGNPAVKQKVDQRSMSPGTTNSNLDPALQRNSSNVTGNLKEGQHFTGIGDDEKMMDLMSVRIRSDVGHRKRNPATKRHLLMKKHIFATSQVGGRKKPVAEKSGAKLAIFNKVDLEVSVKLKQELARLQSEILSKIQMKQALAQTASRLQNLCVKHQQDVRTSEEHVKENKMKTESIRRELMMTELKRTSAIAELRGLNADIENRRLLLAELSHEETIQKQLQRITTAHHEELDHSAQKTEDWQRERLHLKSDISFLKQRCLELESEKNDFIAEKTREYDIIKAEIQDQLRRNTQKSTKDVADIERMLHETSDQLHSAQTDATQKQQLNSQLMEQIVYLQKELEKQNQLRDQLLDENVRSLRTIIKEQETMLGTNHKKLRDEMERDVQETKKEADLRIRQLERRYVDQLNSLNSELKSKDVDLQVLNDRVREQDEWLADLMNRVKEETYQKFQMHLDEERDKWESNKKHDLSTQMETMKMEIVSKSMELREELEKEQTLSASYLQQLNDLRLELGEARLRNHLIYQKNVEADRDLSSDADQLKDQERTAEKLRDSVDECKEQIERLEMEKILLVAKQNAGEKAEKKFLEDLNREYRVVCEILHKPKPDDTVKSVSSMKNNQSDTRLGVSMAMLNLKSSLIELGEKFSGQEREIENLKTTVTRLNKQMTNKQLSMQGQYVSKEKEEAQETRQDRLVDKKHTVETYNEDDLKKALKERERRLQDIEHKWIIWKEHTTQALVNKCREEVNKEMERRLVENKREAVLGSTPMTTTDSEVETITSETPIDIKLTTTPNYSYSNQEHNKLKLTLEKQLPASETLSYEVKEIIAKMQQPPVALGTSSIATGYRPTSRNLVTSPVQDTAQLYSGANTSSLCNSGVVTKDQLIARQLQMQIDRVENGRRVAEDRANENEHLLNQKLVEMTQLQTIVTHQNKELMQLQRAYGQLQKSNR